MGERIAALFRDGGQAVLSDAGMAASWDEVIRQMKLTIPEAEQDRGDAVLTRLRDQCARRGMDRPSHAFTGALYAYRCASVGEEHPDALLELGALGALADRRGDTAKARMLLEQAWRGLKSNLKEADLRLATVGANLGLHYIRSADLSRADQALTQAYTIRKALAPTTVRRLSSQLADIRMKQGALDEAIELLKESLTLHIDQLGKDSQLSLRRARVLIRVLNQQRRFGETVYILDEFGGLLMSDLKEPQAAELRAHMAVAFYDTGRAEVALREIEHAVRITRTLVDEDGLPDAALAGRLITWARMLEDRGHRSQAEGLMKEALDVDIQVYGPDSAQVGLRYATLGELCRHYGRLEEALGWMEAGASILVEQLGKQDEQACMAVEHLVEGLLAYTEYARDELKDNAMAHQLLDNARHWTVEVLGLQHSHMRVIREFEI